MIHDSTYGIPILDNNQASLSLDPVGLLRSLNVISSRDAYRLRRGLRHLQNVVTPVLQKRGYDSTTFLNAELCPTGFYEKEGGGRKIGFEVEIVTIDWSDSSRVCVRPLIDRQQVSEQVFTSTGKQRTYYQRLLEKLEQLFSDPNVIAGSKDEE